MAENNNKKNIYTIENNDLIINWSIEYKNDFDKFDGNKHDFPLPDFDFEEFSKIEDCSKIENIWINYPDGIRFKMSKRNQFTNLQSIKCNSCGDAFDSWCVLISCVEIFNFVVKQCPKIKDIHVKRWDSFQGDDSLFKMIKVLKKLNRPLLFTIEEKVIYKEDRLYKNKNVEKTTENGNLKIFYKTTNNLNNETVNIYVEFNDVDK